jgi:hypothetical protein
MANGNGVARLPLKMRSKIFSRENLFALLLALFILILIIMMSDSTPQWIYQGF